MVNFLQDGEVLQYSNAGSAISSGDVVAIGNRVGVAMVDIAATTGVGSVRMSGVYIASKDGDEAFVVGDELFFDSADSTFTKVAAGNKWAGYAFEAATEVSTSCVVKLEPKCKQSLIVAYSAGTNLAANSVTATSIPASNFTAAVAAEPTKAEIDTGIDTLKTAVVTALDLKADNADLETMRSAIETRLDAIDTGIAALITSLKNSGQMANS